MPSSRGSSQLRDRNQVSCTYTGKRIFKKKLPEIIEFTRFLDRWSTYNGVLYFYILETKSWELNLLKIPFKIVSKSIKRVEINLEYMSRPIHWKLKTRLRDFFSFIFISWRLITLQYCSGFCHTLTWISHGVTSIPHPDPPSHLPLYPIPLGLPSAPGPSTCLMHPSWAGDLFHPR